MERRRKIKWWRRKPSLIIEKAFPSFITILIIFATALAPVVVTWTDNEIFDPTAKLTYDEFKCIEKNKTLDPNYNNNPVNEKYKMEYKVLFNVSNRKKSNYDAYLTRSVEYSIEDKNNTESWRRFYDTSSADWEVIHAGKNWSKSDTVVFDDWLPPGNYILTGIIQYDDGEGNIKYLKMVNDTIVI